MTKFSVKKHLKRHHATSKAFYCELCPEGFQRPDLRVYHMDAVHHDSFRCFHCNFQFYMSSSYVEHMQTQHGLLIRVLTSKNKSEVDVPLDRLRFLPQKLDNDVSFKFYYFLEIKSCCGFVSFSLLNQSQTFQKKKLIFQNKSFLYFFLNLKLFIEKSCFLKKFLKLFQTFKNFQIIQNFQIFSF